LDLMISEVFSNLNDSKILSQVTKALTYSDEHICIDLK